MRAFACIAMLLFAAAGQAQEKAAKAPVPCGEVATAATHDGTTMRYAYAAPTGTDAKIAVILLAGGSGFVKLDDAGCPTLLTGNSLIRGIPLFRAAGFATALVDAPSDYQEEDGLAGFRNQPDHAADLGVVIAALRARTGGAVWVAGTSRGTISAVNAGTRLTGAAAPDGVVLTSALTVGTARGRKAWTAQTVYDLPLGELRVPLLVVGHADDKCLRSPAGEMESIIERAGSSRKQMVRVTGGPGLDGAPSLAACEGLRPHGFVKQEEEVAAGIARFVRGGSY